MVTGHLCQTGGILNPYTFILRSKTFIIRLQSDIPSCVEHHASGAPSKNLIGKWNRSQECAPSSKATVGVYSSICSLKATRAVSESMCFQSIYSILYVNIYGPIDPALSATTRHLSYSYGKNKLCKAVRWSVYLVFMAGDNNAVHVEPDGPLVGITSHSL